MCVEGSCELVRAGATREADSRQQLVSGLKSVSMNSSKLLIQSKAFVIDPHAPNAKNLLTNAAMFVHASVSILKLLRDVTMCGVAGR